MLCGDKSQAGAQDRMTHGKLQRVSRDSSFRCVCVHVRVHGCGGDHKNKAVSEGGVEKTGLVFALSWGMLRSVYVMMEQEEGNALERRLVP